ncbi:MULTISPECIES: FKBP-type peptidyl-prolyl cis-trans isomerase [Flavobacteriaceae]|uniref:FKBP-type peptidyl-prolyl cis-trans isomerase n=1 Tax=Flavobacteriaceae TaxID=49546 RepID=UPI00300B36AF
MKYTLRFTLLSIFILLASCKEKPTTADDATALGDTITTSSGLKYLYLKKGNGQKIEMGSMVVSYTDLYIKELDSLLWTTSTMHDSVFKFIQEKETMIKGFTELNSYLVEGDEVVAVLPDSIAYGKEDHNGLPGGSTLVYDPYVVKKVTPKKEDITDTLVQIIKTQKVDDALRFYEEERDKAAQGSFHTDVDLIYMGLLTELVQDSLATEILQVADYMEAQTSDSNTLFALQTVQVYALQMQGKLEEALAEAQTYAANTDAENEAYWQNRLAELEALVDE